METTVGCRAYNATMNMNTDWSRETDQTTNVELRDNVVVVVGSIEVETTINSYRLILYCTTRAGEGRMDCYSDAVQEVANIGALLSVGAVFFLSAISENTHPCKG